MAPLACKLLLILLDNRSWFVYTKDVYESGILDYININSVSMEARARQPRKEIGAMTNNLRKSSRKRWTPDEVRYLRKNYGRRKLEELSREMGRGVVSIKVAARALGIDKSKRAVRSRK